ncbi:unnamed protein product, partial [Heterosigma akashiwo]
RETLSWRSCAHYLVSSALSPRALSMCSLTSPPTSARGHRPGRSSKMILLSVSTCSKSSKPHLFLERALDLRAQSGF